MILVDDLLYTLTFKPFIQLVELLKSQSLREKYDIQDVQDSIKENRMLYEFGEIEREEYEERKTKLEKSLKIARRVHKTDIKGKTVGGG